MARAGVEFLKLGEIKLYRSDISINGDVYMRRWVFSTPWGALRLHNILRSDADRHLHDHPFDFTTFLLTGGYTEYVPDEEERLLDGRTLVTRMKQAMHYRPRFSRLRRKAEDLHRLELNEGPVWTLVWAGPVRRTWGFWTEDGWIHHSQYDEWKEVHAAGPATSVTRVGEQTLWSAWDFAAATGPEKT